MKGLERSLSRAPDAHARIVTKRIPVNASFVVDGATGAGDGQVAIEGLPEGNILLLGAKVSLQFAGPGDEATLDAGWVGDFSVGSTADANDTLDGTDVNVIASTELAAATAEVSPQTEAENVTAAFIDNTTAATGLFINLLIDDGNVGADDIPFLVTGEVNLAYIVMGDA